MKKILKSHLSFRSMHKKMEEKRTFFKHALWSVSIFPTFPYLEWLFVEKQPLKLDTMIYDSTFFAIHLFFSVYIITKEGSQGDQQHSGLQQKHFQIQYFVNSILPTLREMTQLIKWAGSYNVKQDPLLFIW